MLFEAVRWYRLLPFQAAPIGADTKQGLRTWLELRSTGLRWFIDLLRPHTGEAGILLTSHVKAGSLGLGRCFHYKLDILGMYRFAVDTLDETYIVLV